MCQHKVIRHEKRSFIENKSYQYLILANVNNIFSTIKSIKTEPIHSIIQLIQIIQLRRSMTNYNSAKLWQRGESTIRRGNKLCNQATPDRGLITFIRKPVIRERIMETPQRNRLRLRNQEASALNEIKFTLRSRKRKRKREALRKKIRFMNRRLNNIYVYIFYVSSNTDQAVDF